MFEDKLRSSVHKVVRDAKGESLGDEEVLRNVGEYMGSSARELVPYEILIMRYMSEFGYS